MFVTGDGEDLARKVFRMAQNGTKCEGRERKIKGVIKNSIIIYIRDFPQENIN
jgi:hypothetical protein